MIDKATYAALDTDAPNSKRLTGFAVTTEKHVVTNTDDDGVVIETYEKLRERVQASWEWHGLSEATARMLVRHFNQREQRLAAYPATGSFVYTGGALEADDESFLLVNMQPDPAQTKIIKQGWPLCIWPDQTIYTVAADASLPSEEPNNGELVSPTRVGMAFDYDPAAQRVYSINAEASGSTDRFAIRVTSANGAIQYYGYSGLTGGTSNGHGFSGVPTYSGLYISVAPTNDRVFFSYSDNYVGVLTKTLSAAPGTPSLYEPNMAGKTWPSSGYRKIKCDDTNDRVYIEVAAIDVSDSRNKVYRYDMDLTNETEVFDIYRQFEIESIIPDEDNDGVWITANGVVYYYDNTTAELNTIDYAPKVFQKIGDTLYYFDNDNNDIGACDLDFSNRRIVRQGLNHVPMNDNSCIIDPENNYLIWARQSDLQHVLGSFQNDAVAVSVDPAITASTATSPQGSEVYFFFTESCDAYRSNPAHGFTVRLSGEFVTRWYRGPDIEQEED